MPVCTVTPQLSPTVFTTTQYDPDAYYPAYPPLASLVDWYAGYVPTPYFFASSVTTALPGPNYVLVVLFASFGGVNWYPVPTRFSFICTQTAAPAGGGGGSSSGGGS